MSDGVQVTGHARHQIAGTVLAVEFHVLPLDFVVQEVTNPVECALRYTLIGHAVEIYNDNTEQSQADHQGDQLVESAFVLGHYQFAALNLIEQVHDELS